MVVQHLCDCCQVLAALKSVAEEVLEQVYCGIPIWKAVCLAEGRHDFLLCLVEMYPQQDIPRYLSWKEGWFWQSVNPVNG